MRDASILLVDSSPTLLLLERTLLARRGFRISSASTAAEAMSHLDREVPSLIVSADRLPDGVGTDLCRAVRRSPRTCEVPFVFVVGRRDDALLAACREAGGSDILFKPLRGTDVDATVNTLLGLEVRRWERRTLHTLVSIEEAPTIAGAPRHLAAVNVTPDGMAAEAAPGTSALPVGAKLSILFYVPTHHEAITGEVEVVWNRILDARPRYGLRFLRLVPGAIQRIAAWGGFARTPGN